jgi:hypothetical protein
MGRPSHVPVRYHQSKVGHVYDYRNPGYLTKVETNRRQARALVLQAAFPTFAEALARMGGGRRAEDGGRRTEDWGQRSEVRGRRSEVGGRRTGSGGRGQNPKSEVRNPKEIRGPKSEIRMPLTQSLSPSDGERLILEAGAVVGLGSAWPDRSGSQRGASRTGE